MPATPALSPSTLPRLVLRRRRTGVEGTFGVLHAFGAELAAGELPWRDNRYAVSCIPPGLYRAVRRMTENRGQHLRLLAVPGREDILVHAGHWCGDEAAGFRTDVRGCLLLGTGTAELAGQEAMLRSREALDRVFALVPHGCDLEVVDETPGGAAGRHWAAAPSGRGDEPAPAR